MSGWDWDSRDSGRRETALPYSKETQVGRRGPAVPKRERRTPAVREAQELFKTIVCSEDCLVEGNGPCEPPLQAAHVVPAAVLRKRGLGHLVYDPTNAIPLCYRHHRRHDNWTEKIPRHVLPARCFAWAEAHGVLDALEAAWPCRGAAMSGHAGKEKDFGGFASEASGTVASSRQGMSEPERSGLVGGVGFDSPTGSGADAHSGSLTSSRVVVSTDEQARQRDALEAIYDILKQTRGSMGIGAIMQNVLDAEIIARAALAAFSPDGTAGQ